MFQDAESIFTMPPGHDTPAMNPVDGDADLTVTGTLIVVYPATHAWGEWHHLSQILGLSAADYALQRWRLLKSLKMSVQEVKEESRSNEGSPCGM